MAFGLFRKRLPEPGAPDTPPMAAPQADKGAASETGSAGQILELLEWDGFRTTFKP